MMAELAFLFLLSILNFGCLVVFAIREDKQNQKMAEMLKEYKAIKEHIDNYMLSSDAKKIAEEVDAYFEKVYKSLFEGKSLLAESVEEE